MGHKLSPSFFYFTTSLCFTQHDFFIYPHPRSGLTELWVSNVENMRNARRIFKHTQDIEELAVQDVTPPHHSPRFIHFKSNAKQ